MRAIARTSPRYHEEATVEDHVWPSTGYALDLALSIGYCRKGASSKPTNRRENNRGSAYDRRLSKQRGIFIDAEHALDPEYAANLGVDIDNLLISQPDYGEQGLSITEALVKSGAIDMVVIDSVAALTPRAEIDGGFAEQVVGSHARMMSMALRRLASTIRVPTV